MTKLCLTVSTLLLLCACAPTLVHRESIQTPFTSFENDTVYLTEAGEIENRLYIHWDINHVARSDIAPTTWVGERSISCLQGPAALGYDAVNNTLMRAWFITSSASGANMHVTRGNNIRRVNCPGVSLNETVRAFPETFMNGTEKYVVWWNDRNLRIAKLTGNALTEEALIFTHPNTGSTVNGAFQPSATVLDNETFIATRIGAQGQTNTIHLASSTDMQNWSNTFVSVDRSVAPRPQIIAFEGVLFLFYSGFIPDNEIRYIASDDGGQTWTEPRALDVDTAVEPTGNAGTAGGFGVARHHDSRDGETRLVVAWTTDQVSQDPPILVSVYDVLIP